MTGKMFLDCNLPNKFLLVETPSMPLKQHQSTKRTPIAYIPRARLGIRQASYAMQHRSQESAFVVFNFLILLHGEKEAVFGSYPAPYLGMPAKSFQKLWSPLGRSSRNPGNLLVW